MALTGLKENALKLILFGGKGGVGKTTCASSTGFYLAKEGFKTLVISTDPAHSLSDSLGQKIGDEIKDVEGVQNLNVLEVNAQKALSQFKVKYEAQIKKIFALHQIAGQSLHLAFELQCFFDPRGKMQEIL